MVRSPTKQSTHLMRRRERGVQSEQWQSGQMTMTECTQHNNYIMAPQCVPKSLHAAGAASLLSLLTAHDHDIRACTARAAESTSELLFLIPPVSRSDKTSVMQ